MEPQKKIIERPMVTINNFGDKLTVHNYTSTTGKIILGREEASLLLIELYKFLDQEKQ